MSKKKTAATPTAEPDLLVENLGTMWQIRTNTDAGRVWVEEHVHIEPLFGNEKSFLGDWRPMRDIVLGASADGLVAVWA